MEIVYKILKSSGAMALMNGRLTEVSNDTIERSTDIDALAVDAKASNVDMERLLERFKAYLRSCASRFGSGLDEGSREEMYGSAMLAFYEAVQKYDPDRGHFFPFASQTIKTRLIDYIRKERRQGGFTVPLDDEFGEASSPQSAAIAQMSIRSYESAQEHASLAEEIKQFTAELAGWGISMYSLTECSPKHQRLREEYDAVVSKMIQMPDIMQTIQLKRYFPIKAVSGLTGISAKKLERARNYLLASVIIIMGDYDYLSEYVSGRRYS